MTIALGFKGGVLGFKTETAWGTAVTPTAFLELLSGKINKAIQVVDSKAIPKIYTDDDEFSQGGIKVDGSFDWEMRYEGSEVLLLHAMGTCTTTEVATFTVATGTNDSIDFNIGASELTGTLVAGTYIAGATQATAASMCKMIYDAIHAAEATGTYTVSFSTTTKKFTITRSTGTFQLLWNTGTHKATDISTLCGFSDAADDTGAVTYTSDSAVVTVYDNVFTLADELPTTGFTAELDEDVTAFSAEGCKVDTLALAIEYNNYLKASLGISAEDVNTGTATSATLPTAALVSFSAGVCNYADVAKKIISAKINLNNKLKKDIVVIGQRTIEAQQRGGKREITGSIQIYFEATTEYAAFVAATSVELELVFTGAAIKTGFYYTLTLTCPICKFTGATPNMSNEGPITLDLPFKAYATDSTTKEMTVTLRNRIASVA